MQIRATAEQIAALIAGQLASSSQEDGDRFSLKESNSIKALIAEAVLRAQCAEHQAGAAGRRQAQIGGQRARHGDLRRDCASKARRGRACRARTPPRRSAIRARSFCRRTRNGSLELFQRAYELAPDDPENLLALALVQFRLGDIPSVEALIEKARGVEGQAGREDIAALIDMFAGVLHLRGGRFAEATERFERRRPHLRRARQIPNRRSMR